MRHSKQVVVASNLQATEAHLLRGRLEAEGIRCWVDDENVASVNPLYGLAIGGVKVKVAEDDAALALQLMYGEGAAEAQCPVCPACGSTDVGENATPFIWLLVLTLLTFGLFLPLGYKKHQCVSCGVRW